MSDDKTNYGILIDPEHWYVVPYHFNSKGERIDSEEILQGKDLTENQIKAMINRVDLDELVNPLSS
jgi:hypothetical protein